MDAKRYHGKTLGVGANQSGYLTWLLDLGLAEMRDEQPFVTVKGQDLVWVAD